MEPSGEPFSGTWPRSGMTWRGTAYRLQPLAPRTAATGSSPLLPTPHGFAKEGQARKPGPTGNELGRSLTLLPTPRTSDQNGAGEHGQGGLDLRTAVKLLPTPRSMDASNARSSTSTRNSENFQPGVTLSDVAYEWSGGRTVQRSSGGKPFTDERLRLSPKFVEWMMGTPSCGECGRGWTDSDCPHSATAFTSTSAGSSEKR